MVVPGRNRPSVEVLGVDGKEIGGAELDGVAIAIATVGVESGSSPRPQDGQNRAPLVIGVVQAGQAIN
jgi:hypothetical protein